MKRRSRRGAQQSEGRRGRQAGHTDRTTASANKQAEREQAKLSANHTGAYTISFVGKKKTKYTKGGKKKGGAGKERLSSTTTMVMRGGGGEAKREGSGNGLYEHKNEALREKAQSETHIHIHIPTHTHIEREIYIYILTLPEDRWRRTQESKERGKGRAGRDRAWRMKGKGLVRTYSLYYNIRRPEWSIYRPHIHRFLHFT